MNKKSTRYLAILVIAYAIWAGVFIFKSSLVAIDGNRYFSLADDAMISMRYAWNLSHGNGLVWNVGERVEGYSNLLTTLIMSLMTWAFDKKTAVLAMQLLGIPTVLASAWLARKSMFQAARAAPFAEAASLTAFLLTLTFYPLSYWSLMGMESGLVTVLILGNAFFLLRWEDTRRPSWLIFASLFAGLAFLARNETILFSAVSFSYAAWVMIKDRDTRSLPPLVKAAALYAVFVVGLVIFRWSYYGELMPNTYTLKLGQVPMSVRLNDGVIYLLGFFEGTWPLYILAIAALFLSPARWKWYCFALSVVALLYVVWIGGDAWIRGRLIAPTIPLAIMLASFSIHSLGANFTRFPKGSVAENPSTRTSTLRGLASGLLVALLLIGLLTPYRKEAGFIEPIPDLAQNPHDMDLAIGIDAVTSPDATIGVFLAGLIPYYTDRYAIDYLGKSDKHIASLPPRLPSPIVWFQRITVPGHNKYDLYYSIKGLQPTFTQSFHWGNQYLRAYVVRHYVRFEYTDVNGVVTLQLAQDSPDVYWEKGRIIPWGKDQP